MTSEEEDCYYSDYSDHDSLQGIEDAVEDDVQTHSIQVVTKESLLEAQREDLRRVMDMLKLSERHARTLLIHHRWNFERLSTELVEKGRDSLFAEAGVTIAECKKRALPLSYSRSRSLVKCNICIEDVSPHAVTTMDCGHCFCNDCWTEHFIVQINDGQSKHIRCMEHKCNAICDEAVVRNLVNAKYPDIAERFDRHLLESYIVDNNKVKWCPSVPHCGNAIRVEGDSYCEVECTCGLQFCFNCSLEAHSPCSCQMWELWAKKCQDESETVNWITVKTKPCPKCFKNVEKNGGCNLVTCICKQVFCWLCGGASGREHFCGRDKQVTSVKAARAQRDLHRYMHYYNRYKAHTDSLKLESKLKATIQDRIYFSESKESGLRDHSWAMKGLHRLFRSRRILSYSYPFAFYMFGEDHFTDEMTREELELKQNLFENQQEQLEVNVERLSMSIEQPFDELPKDKVWEVRMQIINLTTLIDKLCKKMYECIDNDLLGALPRMLNIAPYKSMGVERASELSVSLDSNPSSMSMEACNSDSYLQQDSPANKAV
ncbi:probable E3 ubiquitin-protein ligase ARI2 isoform X2 [Magnolia sinica]|uniref:probable E3 ubiquitin-protein ligase ARI2 isoform X2 n=1 Tax=Magnolia sinica TaxID=86752 RepID=UPI002657CEC2|nr:probable E3 ubiquitin-protein ligase ARI2 isoform X2 [Magnolia sinica]